MAFRQFGLTLTAKWEGSVELIPCMELFTARMNAILQLTKIPGQLVFELFLLWIFSEQIEYLHLLEGLRVGI